MVISDLFLEFSAANTSKITLLTILKMSYPDSISYKFCLKEIIDCRVALTEEFGKHHGETSPQNSVPQRGSDSEWSRVSSANSLEWDNVQNSLHVSPPASDIDTDTQLLLCEIERLTSQTLSETGLDLNCDC